MIRRPPISTLSPYPTLFRSVRNDGSQILVPLDNNVRARLFRLAHPRSHLMNTRGGVLRRISSELEWDQMVAVSRMLSGSSGIPVFAGFREWDAWWDSSFRSSGRPGSRP